MRILVSTFTPQDVELVIRSMRSIGYDRLVVLCRPDDSLDPALERIRRLEDMSGHEITVQHIYSSGFMETVDEICQTLGALQKERRTGTSNEVILNISAGEKLLANAALFAAFRLGVRTVHCDEKLVKLPILAGATAVDRFTPLEVRAMRAMLGGATLDELQQRLGLSGRQSVDRIVRELKKTGLVMVISQGMPVTVDLSEVGREVLRSAELSSKG